MARGMANNRKFVAACMLIAAIVATGAGYGPGLAGASGVSASAGVEPRRQDAHAHGSGAHEQWHGHGDARSEEQAGKHEGRQWHEGKDKERHHGGGMREIAKLLGMPKDELKTALMSGKTLAELAKERGVDRQKVVDVIAARMQKRLDARLKEGEVTQQEYDVRKARIPELAARIVDEGMHKRRGMEEGKQSDVKQEDKRQPEKKSE